MRRVLGNASGATAFVTTCAVTPLIDRINTPALRVSPMMHGVPGAPFPAPLGATTLLVVDPVEKVPLIVLVRPKAKSNLSNQISHPKVPSHDPMTG